MLRLCPLVILEIYCNSIILHTPLCTWLFISSGQILRGETEASTGRCLFQHSVRATKLSPVWLLCQKSQGLGEESVPEHTGAELGGKGCFHRERQCDVVGRSPALALMASLAPSSQTVWPWARYLASRSLSLSSPIHGGEPTCHDCEV